MPRGKKIAAEQIIAKLREAEVELARGEEGSGGRQEDRRHIEKFVNVLPSYRDAPSPTLPNQMRPSRSSSMQ